MPEQAAVVERETCGQSLNKAWFLHRAGRVTALNLKAAAVTNPAMPSQSVIKKICYADAFMLSTRATR